MVSNKKRPGISPRQIKEKNAARFRAERDQLLEWITWSFQGGPYTVKEIAKELREDNPTGISLEYWNTYRIGVLLSRANFRNKAVNKWWWIEKKC